MDLTKRTLILLFVVLGLAAVAHAQPAPSRPTSVIVTSGTVTFTNTHIQLDASTAVIGHVICDSGCTGGGGGGTVDQGAAGVSPWLVAGTVAFSNTSLAVTNAGTFAVQASLAAETTKVIGTVNIAAAQSVAITGSVAVTGPLTDTQLRASAVPVSLASVPSHAVTNTGTFAVQCTSGCSAGTPGQATMAASSPVVIASDQSAVAVSNAGLTNLDITTSALRDAIAGTSTLTDVVTAENGTSNTIAALMGNTALAGIYIQQDNNLSIARETGGNLASIATRTAPFVASGAGGYVRQDSTATMAKETGGNLATVATNTGNIPAKGQALAAGSLPVVLTAIQQTALTPPAAITGFALEAGHLATIDTSTAKIPSQGQALAAGSLPVVLPAAQITTLTPPAAITGFALEAGNLATIATNTTSIATAARQDTIIAATHLEDSAFADGDRGVGLLGVRQDSPGTQVSATGEYEMLQLFQGWLRAQMAAVNPQGAATALQTDGGGNLLVSAGPATLGTKPLLALPCNALRRTNCR